MNRAKPRKCPFVGSLVVVPTKKEVGCWAQAFALSISKLPLLDRKYSTSPHLRLLQSQTDERGDAIIMNEDRIIMSGIPSQAAGQAYRHSYYLLSRSDRKTSPARNQTLLCHDRRPVREIKTVRKRRNPIWFEYAKVRTWLYITFFDYQMSVPCFF